MTVRRYPCRICGGSTEGDDTYVVCASCLARVESQASDAALGGPLRAQLSPEEIEARLRRLLDDW